MVDAIDWALVGGVDSVQLREKDLSDDELLMLALRVKAKMFNRGELLVNSSKEVALECGADGVHLPEIEPPVERPNRPFLVGRSVHSAEGAVLAVAEGPDYLIAGPIWQTNTHPDQAPLGIRLIERIVAQVQLPVLAIGGITPPRVEAAIQAGAYGIAVVSAILAASDPMTGAIALSEALCDAFP